MAGLESRKGQRTDHVRRNAERTCCLLWLMIADGVLLRQLESGSVGDVVGSVCWTTARAEPRQSFRTVAEHIFTVLQAFRALDHELILDANGVIRFFSRRCRHKLAAYTQGRRSVWID